MELFSDDFRFPEDKKAKRKLDLNTSLASPSQFFLALFYHLRKRFFVSNKIQCQIASDNVENELSDNPKSL